MRHTPPLCPASGQRVSIHAPREGCDVLSSVAVSPVSGFQSTHPVRGATETTGSSAGRCPRFQSTHPVRGATRDRAGHDVPGLFQSTHPVRGATVCLIELTSILEFQSTHPVRGATAPKPTPQPSTPVSIHAPREGCDVDGFHECPGFGLFQSTHPVRGATSRLNPALPDSSCFNPRTP